MSIDQRCDRFLERLADIGMRTASEGFSGAQYDGENDVSVRVERDSATTFRVVASGQAVAFIEFGSGVTMGYGHPVAGALGFGPGTYPGKGHWDNPKGWTYRGVAGTNGVAIWSKTDIYRTLGNPPAMALQNATEDMLQQIFTIAEEVFGQW